MVIGDGESSFFNCKYSFFLRKTKKMLTSTTINSMGQGVEMTPYYQPGIGL
jgi:hypothetical protein